jgi:hypothetical protein
MAAKKKAVKKSSATKKRKPAKARASKKLKPAKARTSKKRASRIPSKSKVLTRKRNEFISRAIRHASAKFAAEH